MEVRLQTPGYEPPVMPDFELLEWEHRIKVLLIDDDPLFQELVRASLDHRYFEVDVFSSLSVLQNYADMSEYDIVILDHYLPEVTGLEIAQYVDMYFQNTPVIMVSGGHPGNDPAWVWPGCIQKYVTKKSGISALVSAVMDICMTRELFSDTEEA